MSAIRTSLDSYLDAAESAAKWGDARFTPDALRKERERQSKPARDALEARIPVERRDATAARAAYSEALTKALHDDSDSNRVLARELAWQRLIRRAERGESLEAIARTATAVELEAIAAFAPAEMPYLQPNAAGRTPEDWRAYVEESVADAYTTHPTNVERFAPLAEKAAQAEETLVLADLGSAILEGRQLDGGLRNRVYNVDPDLYRRVTAQ